MIWGSVRTWTSFASDRGEKESAWRVLRSRCEKLIVHESARKLTDDMLGQWEDVRLVGSIE